MKIKYSSKKVGISFIHLVLVNVFFLSSFGSYVYWSKRNYLEKVLLSEVSKINRFRLYGLFCLKCPVNRFGIYCFFYGVPKIFCIYFVKRKNNMSVCARSACVCLRIYVHMCVHMRACMYVCVYMYVCVCVYVS